jgi:hypothetical protein
MPTLDEIVAQSKRDVTCDLLNYIDLTESSFSCELFTTDVNDEREILNDDNLELDQINVSQDVSEIATEH